MIRSYLIGRVPIHVTSVQDTCDRIRAVTEAREKGYVCISNMRTVVAANRDPAYLDVMEHSLLNTPDGTPLVWCGKAWGLKEVQRVVGLDVFTAMQKTGISQFFLGDTEETLKALTDRLTSEGANVAGSFSPPFAPLDDYDLQMIADRINASGAQVVWTALRAPKQDFLASRLLPYLNDGIVLVGIGAAFRIYLGEYELDRGVLQRMGLGGLKMVRNSTLFKELKWYLVHGAYLFGYLVEIFWKRLTHRV